MSTKISDLSDYFYKFVKDNASEDALNIKLKYAKKDLDFPLDFAIIQIALRFKTRYKLKSFLTSDRFIFPSTISSEQASDELVAKYNAFCVGSGVKVLDMTAGLGIDSLSFAMNDNSVTSIEIDGLKCEVLEHNAHVMNVNNRIRVICSDSVEYIKSLSSEINEGKYSFDVIYIDPARRDGNNKRTYSFSDCEPNILQLLPSIKLLAPRILIKASPLLDITHILNEIEDVKMIHIVSARGECKELLIEIMNNSAFEGVNDIEYVNNGEIHELHFNKEELLDIHAPILENEGLKDGYYLYEPNPGLMKINAYGALCSKFPEMKRISPNTSLYVSNILYSDFPGRKFIINNILDKKDLKLLKGEKLNIAVRNYPLSAQELSRKIKTKEGDDRFLFAFRAYEKAVPTMILAKKI